MVRFELLVLLSEEISCRYNLFGLFWGLFFVDALCKLTLAGTFASYYWAYNKPQDVPALPVTKAFYRATRCRLFSVLL